MERWSQMKVLMGRRGTLTVAENSCDSNRAGPDWNAVRVNRGTAPFSVRVYTASSCERLQRGIFVRASFSLTPPT